MNAVSQDRRRKVEKYFAFIRERFLHPIEEEHEGKVGGSCFAALVMMLSVIDALGRLLHKKPCAGVGERFKWFLAEMGEPYNSKRDRIYCLRNDLVHQASNKLTAVSAHDAVQAHHLTERNNVFFVHTAVFFRDLKRAVEDWHSRIPMQPALLCRVADRLETKEPSSLEERSGVTLEPGTYTPEPTTF